jgi:predicted Zn-dependent protease
MLFDLRGRHRRRAVKFIYVGLALLIGGGLILFGVGAGSSGGGLLNAATENSGSSSASFSGQIKKYEKATQKQPGDAAGWEKLAAALLHEAGGEGFTTSTGTLTSKGRELYSRASRAWERYLALNPPKPSLELAKLMLRVYDAEGLNEPSSAVQVLQQIVAAEPNNAAFYSQLAVYAYKAKNVSVGDLASEKAVSLAPANDRQRVKKELETLKKNPEGETLTTTTNGTTYTGKANSEGGFVGTAVKKTPQPKTSSTPSATKK